MLFYHPAFDVYHAIFRLLVILDSNERKWIELERLRIYDFYLLFPRELGSVRMSPLMLTTKRELSRLPQYEAIENPARVFYRLEPLFNHAVDFLLLQGFIEKDANDIPQVRLLGKALEPDLEGIVAKRKEQSSLPLMTLHGELNSYSLFGPSGLKARTNLLPSRYDRK